MNSLKMTGWLVMLAVLGACTSNTTSTETALVAPGGYAPSATFVVRENQLLRLSSGGSGTGTLVYQGWQYDFTLENMTLSTIADGKVELEGKFFNLNELTSVEGTFQLLQANMQSEGQLRGVWMKNENDVLAYVETKGQAVGINLASTGSRLTLD